METKRIATTGFNTELRRLRLHTIHRNNVFVEEINTAELEHMWDSISEVQMIF